MCAEKVYFAALSPMRKLFLKNIRLSFGFNFVKNLITDCHQTKHCVNNYYYYRLRTICVQSLDAKRFVQEESADQLLDEFLDYGLSPDAVLPDFLPDDTSLDSFWFQMEAISVISGNKRFQHLQFVTCTAIST